MMRTFEIAMLALGWLGGVASNIWAADLYDRLPKIAEKLVRRAAMRQPPELRERRVEEWLAHLADCDGKLERLSHALGVWWRARSVAEASKRPEENPRRKMRLNLDRSNAGTALMCLGLSAEVGSMYWAGAPLGECAMYLIALVPGLYALYQGLWLRRRDGKFAEI